VAGGQAFVETVRVAWEDAPAPRVLGAFTDVLAEADSGPPPVAVLVEVPRGAEFQLDLIAALRRHPALADAVLVVGLEDATRRNVLRCGALGLLEVVPAGIEPAALRERLSRWMQRVAAVAHPRA
jgi:hypothetical protein